MTPCCTGKHCCLIVLAKPFHSTLAPHLCELVSLEARTPFLLPLVHSFHGARLSGKHQEGKPSRKV